MLKDEHEINENDFFALLDQFDGDKDKVIQAYYYSKEKHKGQKRLSGENYIMHPMKVAQILLNQKMDTDTVCAGLLHDVLEDTKSTKEELLALFNAEVVKLVKGVTKISVIRSTSKFISKHEDLRRFIISMIDDVRVIIIKLADRLHNMQTLKYQPHVKQLEIAKNTLDLYAPIAARLGMEFIKNDLEDMALYYLDSKAYQYIKDSIAQKIEKRQEIIVNKIKSIKKILIDEGVERYSIVGRTKHFYSIYTKMKDHNKSFNELYDLLGLRILTQSKRDCYTVLGIIHNHFKPMMNRFKDYIANPKSNLYQSLHTTVVDDDGKQLEIQIRTNDMEAHAEYGIAAHWMYKENTKNSNKKVEEDIKFFNKLKQLNKHELSDDLSFENLKNELLIEEIFVFTPKGDIVDLPKGSTALDFAFAIHTEVGYRCIGVKINGKLFPIRKELKQGDVIEVLTSNSRVPAYDWLEFVKTHRAREKLRAFFRRMSNDNKEQKIKLAPAVIENIVYRVKSEKETRGDYHVYIMGNNKIQYQFASCCNPMPADKIIGNISSAKKAVIIHKKDCGEIQRLFNEGKTGKLIDVDWNNPFKSFARKYSVNAYDNSTKFITSLISTIDSANMKLKKLEMNLHAGNKVFCSFTIEAQSEDNFMLFEQSIKKSGNSYIINRVN